MPATMKIGLLALVGAAAAVPQLGGGHAKYHHKRSGYAGPTDGWTPTNGTATGPVGTATSAESYITTLVEDQTSTYTLVKTIYATKPWSGVDAVPTSAVAQVVSLTTGAADVCGPSTVYVTATEKVTVTVPAGSAPAPSTSTHSTTTVVLVPQPVVESSEYPTSEAAAVPVASETAPSYHVQTLTDAMKEEASTPVAIPSNDDGSVSGPSEHDVQDVAPVPVTTSHPEASSSSSDAKPSSVSKPFSGKRGLIYRWDAAADCKSFVEKRSFGFASNWEADPKGNIGAIPFIPTLRSLDRAADWEEKAEAAIAAGSNTLFTFNEPDIHSQANLDVAAACSAWSELVSPIAKKHPGVTIVGPSISSADPTQNPGMGLNWLKDFSTNCPTAQWSVANYHWYGGPDVGFKAFKAYIEQAHSEIKKPFYVSEFGLNPGASEAEAAEFLKEAQEYLDGNADCVGYSYFAAGSFPTEHVLLGSGDNPTMAGSIYLS